MKGTLQKCLFVGVMIALVFFGDGRMNAQRSNNATSANLEIAGISGEEVKQNVFSMFKSEVATNSDTKNIPTESSTSSSVFQSVPANNAGSAS